MWLIEKTAKLIGSFIYAVMDEIEKIYQKNKDKERSKDKERYENE